MMPAPALLEDNNPIVYPGDEVSEINPEAKPSAHPKMLPTNVTRYPMKNSPRRD